VEEIIINENVHDFLEELVYKLYKKEYFGFVDSAYEYVDKIYDFIYNELPNAQHKETPKELLRHGKYYVKCSANKRTAWYVFFNKKEGRILVKYITNNHVAKAAFIKGLK
jgi:hypothetical protein